MSNKKVIRDKSEFEFRFHGERLKWLRLNSGLSLRALSSLISALSDRSASRATIDLWERKNRDTQGSLILALSKVLNVHPSSFYTEEVEEDKSYINKIKAMKKRGDVPQFKHTGAQEKHQELLKKINELANSIS